MFKTLEGDRPSSGLSLFAVGWKSYGAARKTDDVMAAASAAR
jgi:hypothetical protein